MNLKLLTKANCEKCDYVKGKIPEGVSVEILDAESADGMAEMAYYQLIGEHTPILIVDNKEIVRGALNIRKRIEGAVGE